MPDQATGHMHRRAIEAAAEASNDVVGRAFWWSNCIQLRWMLWAMSHGGSLEAEEADDPGGDAGAGIDDFDWVMQVQSLRSQRRHVPGIVDRKRPAEGRQACPGSCFWCCWADVHQVSASNLADTWINKHHSVLLLTWQAFRLQCFV